MKVLLTLAICLILVSGCTTQQEWDTWKKITQHPQERRQQYINANPELSAKTVELILAGQIALGMTSEEVEASWGHPYPVNRSVGSWGTHEQWVFRVSRYTTHYLYFEGGILTSWSD